MRCPALDPPGDDGFAEVIGDLFFLGLELHHQTLPRTGAQPRVRELLARRVQSLRNGPRTRSLLKLITAGIANEVNRDEWAARIYDHLESNDRRPARLQRAVAGIGLFEA